MTAFDQAWALLKNWTPNWRDEARLLDDFELPENLKSLRTEDWKNTQIPGFVGQGVKVAVFDHPLDPSFVMKVPYGHERNLERFDTRNERDDLVEMLEQLGYPLMGELQRPQGYSIQPKLGSARGKYFPEQNIADTALMHLVSDRHNQNWGIDTTTGKIRNFDLDAMGWTDDWWPYEALDTTTGEDKGGEIYQSNLDKYGIQHPASKLLDIIPKLSYDEERTDPLGRLQSFRSVMEDIEPYSDNPKTLTVHGKPIWLEEEFE